MSLGGSTVRRFTAPARFEIPALPSAHVTRQDLVDELGSSPARLTAVVASIGAGKTALLSSWAHERRDPTVWMTCDPTDADPVRFWWALTEAVQRAAPDAGLDAQARLDDEGQESSDAAASLATDCGLIPSGAVVLDDFHLSGASSEALSAFVRALPTGNRLVLGSRRDVAMPLGRLRVQGQALEIRSDRLAFRPDAARAMFDGLGIEVGQEDLVRLCDLTEGWAAGLQLAALSLAGRVQDTAGFVDAFATTDRGVSDFLVNEVLDQQSPEVVEFLTKTSVLDVFDVGLCEALTGRSDAAEVISSLQRAHLFITEVDHRDGWYRYHHLFRAFLRARLRSSSGDGHRAVHAAAAQALAARGDVLGAVEQSMSGDDVHGAFDLVRGLALSRLDLERRHVTLDVVRAWLREHGARVVQTEPRLVVECCIFLAAVGARDDIPTWLRRAAASPVIDDDPTGRALIAVTWGLHSLQQGDPLAALDHVAESLRLAGDDIARDVWISQWTNVTCPAHVLLDDTDAVRRDVAATRGDSAEYAVLDGVRLPAALAWAAAVDGDMGEAERQAQVALDAADVLGLEAANYGRVLPMLVQAVVAAERYDLEPADRCTLLALEGAEGARRHTVLLFCLLERAQLDRSRGDVAGALECVERARQVMPDPTPPVTEQIDRVDAAIAIDVGNPAGRGIVDALSPGPHRALLEARLLLQQDDRRGAAVVLDQHRDLMSTRRLQVEHALLDARSQIGSNRERAKERLIHALRLARPARLIRLVVDAGPEVHELLEGLPQDAQVGPFGAEVLEAIYRRSVPRRKVARGQVDALSEREHEVLRYLASRLSYAEAASELYVSVNTLKTHIKAIYRKLGVASRSDAVTAGRRSGLL